MTKQMKSWEVATEAWDAFNAEEFMSNGIQAVYDAGVRAGRKVAGSIRLGLETAINEGSGTCGCTRRSMSRASRIPTGRKND